MKDYLSVVHVGYWQRLFLNRYFVFLFLG